MSSQEIYTMGIHIDVSEHKHRKKMKKEMRGTHIKRTSEKSRERL